MLSPQIIGWIFLVWIMFSEFHDYEKYKKMKQASHEILTRGGVHNDTTKE
jgi:hypothetical protein